MSKAMLIMDAPENCAECPCCYLTEGCYSDICKAENRGLEEGYREGKPNWCPLREVPQEADIKKAKTMTTLTWLEGWNACIAEILKNKEGEQ